MSEASPKSRIQRPWLINATFGAPGSLSAAVKSRPSAGLTPRIRRKSYVTYAPVYRRGAPSTVMFTVDPFR
jgi:hypothetical protein